MARPQVFGPTCLSPGDRPHAGGFSSGSHADRAGVRCVCSHFHIDLQLLFVLAAPHQVPT